VLYLVYPKDNVVLAYFCNIVKYLAYVGPMLYRYLNRFLERRYYLPIG
jgi:hypothetical protein